MVRKDRKIGNIQIFRQILNYLGSIYARHSNDFSTVKAVNMKGSALKMPSTHGKLLQTLESSVNIYKFAHLIPKNVGKQTIRTEEFIVSPIHFCILYYSTIFNHTNCQLRVFFSLFVTEKQTPNIVMF